MANSVHVARLEEGARAWNAWRAEHPDIVPDLSELSLSVGRRQFGPVQGGPVDLSRANLSGAALDQATLIEAGLAGACLIAADLSHARLERADLGGADLSHANLEQGDLKDARLENARLSGAQLRDARNLTQAQIDGAVGDENTTLPAGLTMPQAWRKEATFSRLARRNAGTTGGAGADPHSILGVRRKASAREIRGAYLRLAKELHPDGRAVDPVAAERLKLINDAYTELKGFGVRAAARKAERKSVARRVRTIFVVGVLTSSAPLLAVLFAAFQSGYFGQQISRQQGPDGSAIGSQHAKRAVEGPQTAWAAAEKSGTREDLQRYLDKYPDSVNAETARRAIAAIDAAEARRQAERSAWAAALKSGAREELQRYLDGYPDGENAGKARQAIAGIEAAEARREAERSAWAAALKSGAREELQRYLSAFPAGSFVTEARKRMALIEAEETQRAEDEAAWSTAERRRSKAAYAAYLRAHPNGLRAREARTRIAELERGESRALAEAVVKEARPPPSPGRPKAAPEPAMSQRWPSADEPFIGADGRIRR
jgi:hypothetical protein